MTSQAKYPSDLSDEQWLIVAPLIPAAKHGGRPRKLDMRAVLDACFYISRTGCQWDSFPKTYPPKSSVHDYYSLWRSDGTWQRIHDALRDKVRRQAQREPEPSAAIIDSQSSKTTEKGGPSAASTRTKRSRDASATSSSTRSASCSKSS